MASSNNRHWPSMFKSKPCPNTHHHQWQHDITNNNSTNNSSLLSSNVCHKASYSSGCEERSPEPKPRWNPRPEQIRILESIFNSGMVNPPRDEIRKIRGQLQEYGQVGDANVFYWFQNRKSRSKHKQRQLQTKQAQAQAQAQQTPTIATTTTTIRTPPTSTSSNSSDKSTPSSFGSKNLMDISNVNSPTASVNNQQPFLQAQSDFLAEPFCFQQPNNTPQEATTNFTQGFCFPDIMTTVSHVAHQSVTACGPSLFFNDLQINNMNNQEISKKVDDDLQKMKLQEEQLIFPLTTASTTSTQIQGICATKSTVFINDVAFEVPVGPFNVKASFGEDAVLFHSSGHPVLADAWGITLHPLQHGAFYFLLRAPPTTPSISHDTAIHLN